MERSDSIKVDIGRKKEVLLCKRCVHWRLWMRIGQDFEGIEAAPIASHWWLTQPCPEEAENKRFLVRVLDHAERHQFGQAIGRNPEDFHFPWHWRPEQKGAYKSGRPFTGSWQSHSVCFSVASPVFAHFLRNRLHVASWLLGFGWGFFPVFDRSVRLSFSAIDGGQRQKWSCSIGCSKSRLQDNHSYQSLLCIQTLTQWSCRCKKNQGKRVVFL